MHPISLFVMALMVARSSQQQLSNCGNTFRRPEYTDISVECGTASIGLSILICPAMYTGYNESLLILNNMFSETGCRGTLDTSVSPPVVRYRFPLNTTNACGSVFRTTSTPGTGIFSDFSNIQTVNISGVVRSLDPTTGTVTYNAELKYYYSCAYPLSYLMNNTQIDVSASSIAVRDTNGSFISTLKMELFSDANYTKPMTIPSLGIELRTNVYVQVRATNLTAQYLVLLDRCYASISAFPTNSSFFNLFVPCSKDQMTTMINNGNSNLARFSFQAFRFVEQQNQSVSTYYLHCITRLCEKSTCSQFMQCPLQRRRRSSETIIPTDRVTEYHTLTSPEIITKAESLTATEQALTSSSDSNSSVGLGVAVGILAFACLIVLTVAAIFYKRLKH